jgi:hypothetical protein
VATFSSGFGHPQHQYQYNIITTASNQNANNNNNRNNSTIGGSVGMLYSDLMAKTFADELYQTIIHRQEIINAATAAALAATTRPKRLVVVEVGMHTLRNNV